MINNFKFMVATLAVVAFTGVIGCGQGFKGASHNGGITAADISNELAKAEEANKMALAAMDEANQALAEITDEKGNINVSLFSRTGTSGDVQTQFLLNGLIDKLRGVFDKVFASVEMVKAKFNEARGKLMEAVAKLDPNDPAQAALIAEINKRVIQIDGMEAKFSNAMHMLAGKLDLAIIGLDKIVSGVTSFIPGFGWLANMALDYFVMGDVKALINELKLRLLAL